MSPLFVALLSYRARMEKEGWTRGIVQLRTTIFDLDRWCSGELRAEACVPYENCARPSLLLGTSVIRRASVDGDRSKFTVPRWSSFPGSLLNFLVGSSSRKKDKSLCVVLLPH